ncbi:MAG: hypothetical protein WC758_03280 [Candidatus Woesearchaeota archaeon]|jgi:septation ring formation regulator EzrA
MEDTQDKKEDQKESKKEKKNLKEEYQKLKITYTLPEYESLEIEFRIEDIDPDENIIRDILEEIHSRIDSYARVLENLIQPDSKLCDMREAGTLTKDDQKSIIEMYRKCMLMNRKLLLVDFDYTPKDAANAITETYTNWQELKKELRPILIKLKNTWLNQEKEEEYGGYYG